MSASALSARSAPSPKAPWLSALRLRARRSLTLEFSELDRLDLGDPAEFASEAAELFTRGGHGRARAEA